MKEEFKYYLCPRCTASMCLICFGGVVRNDWVNYRQEEKGIKICCPCCGDILKTERFKLEERARIEYWRKKLEGIARKISSKELHALWVAMMDERLGKGKWVALGYTKEGKNYKITSA